MRINNFSKFLKIFLIVLVSILFTTPSFGMTTYIAQDLGTLDGYFIRVSPTAINEKGQVVGVGFWDDQQNRTHKEGFIWDSVNGMRRLPSFGGLETNPTDINDIGQVVGWSDYADSRWRHAFLIENDVMYDLGSGWAIGINNSGVIVGGSSTGAFMWDSINGRYNPFGQGDIRPSEINEKGEVVGSTRNSQGYGQGFIWDGTNGLQFIDMPTALQASIGTDINNFSQISGHGDSVSEPHYHHSYIWEGTNVISTLGDLGGNQEWAFGINNIGQIVGNATAPDFMRYGCGFIWDEINGIRNINDLILSKEGFEYISSAIDINDSEMIIAQGIIDEENGIYHSFLLIPIPDAPTIDTILQFFDDSVADGSLTGDGKGNSANGRLNALRNILEMAGDLIAINDIEGACGQLKAASMKCDGESPPPDFVQGDAAESLYDMILELMTELGC